MTRRIRPPAIGLFIGMVIFGVGLAYLTDAGTAYTLSILGLAPAPAPIVVVGGAAAAAGGIVLMAITTTQLIMGAIL